MSGRSHSSVKAKFWRQRSGDAYFSKEQPICLSSEGISSAHNPEVRRVGTYFFNLFFIP